MSTESGGASHAPTFCGLFVAYRTTLGLHFPRLHHMRWPEHASILSSDFIDLDRTRQALAQISEQSKKLIPKFSVWNGAGSTAGELGVELAHLFISQIIATEPLDAPDFEAIITPKVPEYFVSFLNGYQTLAPRPIAVSNLRPEARP